MPPEPETATVTARLCAVVIVLEAGVTVTVGVVGFWPPPPPPWLPPPPPQALVKTAIVNTREARNSFANRFIRVFLFNPVEFE